MPTKPRARDLGIPFDGAPGPFNAITDVTGLELGLSTLVSGSDCRTGVTILHPRGRAHSEPVMAGFFSLNGNGEMTGMHWVEEGGWLEGPIGITNTHSVGVVRDAIIHWQAEHGMLYQPWSCPIVAETADIWLNDMNGFFVKPEHVWSALDNAASGPVAEGNVGGGTGMICYQFKGGTGTSSRKLTDEEGGWTVGVLVQANFGRRPQLQIAGVPVGKVIAEDMPGVSGEDAPTTENGSIIIVVATDAPLLPHQLKRLARRATLGLARTGSMAGNSSGDIFLAFSTGNRPPAHGEQTSSLAAVANDHMDPLFFATAQATEEAIVNALVAAETMRGRDGRAVYALPHERLRAVMQSYNRLTE